MTGPDGRMKGQVMGNTYDRVSAPDERAEVQEAERLRLASGAACELLARYEGFAREVRRAVGLDNQAKMPAILEAVRKLELSPHWTRHLESLRATLEACGFTWDLPENLCGWIARAESTIKAVWGQLEDEKRVGNKWLQAIRARLGLSGAMMHEQADILETIEALTARDAANKDGLAGLMRDAGLHGTVTRADFIAWAGHAKAAWSAKETLERERAPMLASLAASRDEAGRLKAMLHTEKCTAADLRAELAAERLKVVALEAQAKAAPKTARVQTRGAPGFVDIPPGITVTVAGPIRVVAIQKHDEPAKQASMPAGTWEAIGCSELGAMWVSVQAPVDGSEQA